MSRTVTVRPLRGAQRMIRSASASPFPLPAGFFQEFQPDPSDSLLQRLRRRLPPSPCDLFWSPSAGKEMPFEILPCNGIKGSCVYNEK